MTQAHISTLLPIKNRVLAADDQTAFLAHYDLCEHDVLRGVKAMGSPASLSFSSTYVECKNICNMGTKDLTFEAWIKTQSASNDIYLMSKSAAKAANHRYGVALYGGKVKVFMQGNGGADVTPVGTKIVNDNLWHHIAVVFDRDANVSIYVDGVLDTSASISQWSSVDMTSTFPFRLGCYTNSDEVTPALYYIGQMNHVKLTAVAKTVDQIKNSMNGELQEQGLIGYWKLDESSGTVVRDSSAFHNDGIMNNGTWTAGNSVFTMRPQEGKFGGAIAIEEGTTNLIPTPQDWSAWSHWGNTTYWYSWNQYDDLKMGKVFCGNAKTNSYLFDYSPDMTIVIGQPYTLSVYLKSDSVITIPNARAYLASTTEFAPLQSIQVTKEWQRFSWTVTPTGTDTLRGLGYELFGIPDNAMIYAAMPQIEAKSFPTSFVNGIRSNGFLKYNIPNLANDDFTISMWGKCHENNTSSNYYFDIGDHAMYLMNYGTNITLRTIGDMSQDIIYNNGRINEWVMLTVVKSGSNNSLYIDGALVQTRNNPNIAFKDYLTIGVNYQGGSHFNGLIDELRIDKIARTPEEILAWYECNSPFYPRGIYRKSY